MNHTEKGGKAMIKKAEDILAVVILSIAVLGFLGMVIALIVRIWV